MSATAAQPDIEEVLIAVCRRQGVRSYDVLTLTVLSRLLEGHGVRRHQCLFCVRSALRRGWIARGPLLGQVVLTPEGYAAY
jgi:hypothetical protein